MSDQADKAPVDLASLSIHDFVNTVGESGGCKQLALVSRPSVRSEEEGPYSDDEGGGRSVSRKGKRKASDMTAQDIMLLLNEKKLATIQAEFLCSPTKSLTLKEFVGALGALLAGNGIPRDHLAAALCDLFMEIDVDCNQTLDWDEFYSFMHQFGMQRKGDSDMNRRFEDTSVQVNKHMFKKTGGVKFLGYNNWVATWEGSGMLLRLMDWERNVIVIDMHQVAAVIM